MTGNDSIFLSRPKTDPAPIRPPHITTALTQSVHNYLEYTTPAYRNIKLSLVRYARAAAFRPPPLFLFRPRLIPSLFWAIHGHEVSSHLLSLFMPSIFISTGFSTPKHHRLSVAFSILALSRFSAGPHGVFLPRRSRGQRAIVRGGRRSTT